MARLKGIIGPFGCVACVMALACLITMMVLVDTGYAPHKAGYMMIFIYLCVILMGTVVVIFLHALGCSGSHRMPT